MPSSRPPTESAIAISILVCPRQTYGGNYPDALAQSADGKTLYVADSTSDAVAVFDLRESRGTHSQANADRAYYFIPTEWYPTALGMHGDRPVRGHG